MSQYAKFFAAFAGVLGILATNLADGVISSSELESVVTAAVAAFFVWRLPNKQPLDLSRNAGG